MHICATKLSKKRDLLGFSCILLILLSLTIIPNQLCAQIVKVIDKTSKKPIPNVFIYSNSQSIVTNGDGFASLSRFGTNEMVFFQHPAYDNISIPFKNLKELEYVVSLKEAVLYMDDFVISANRWEQNLSEVPNSIAKITVNEIDFQNPQTSADLLNISDKVYVQKSQLGGGSPMIRGFSTNRLLIVVDGVRMNNAIFRSGNLQNVISLDANAIENSEVIFGPGSVIYGSDAIGGVMDFHTLSPSYSSTGGWQVSGRSNLRFSSANNERTLHVHANYGKSRVAGITSISYSEYGDLEMGSHGRERYLRPYYVKREDGIDQVVENDNAQMQRQSGYSQLNVMQKLSIKPTQYLEFKYGLHYSTTGEVPRYDRLIQGEGSDLKYAKWHYGPQQWLMHNLQIQSTYKNPLYDIARLTVAYQEFEESRIDRKLGDNRRRNRTERVDALSFNLDLDRHFNDKNSLYYGAEWVTNDVESTGFRKNIETNEVTSTSSRYPNGSKWSSYAVYVNFKHKIQPNLSMVTGARYTGFLVKADFNKDDYDFPYEHMRIANEAINGSFGLAWKANDNTQIDLNLSTGFRAPNIDDAAKVFDSEPGAVVVPNPDLKAEYAYNAELALARKFGEQFKIELAGFYTWLTDAMVRRDSQFNGQDSIYYDGQLSRVSTLQNADEAKVYGVQAGIKIKLSSALSMRSSYTYMEGETSDKEPLRHLSPNFGATHLVYDKDQWMFDLYAVYNSEISSTDLAPSEKSKVDMYALDDNGEPYSPAWTTLNLKSAYQWSDAIRFYVGVENLLDLRYRPYSSGIVSPGRNFIFSVKTMF